MDVAVDSLNTPVSAIMSQPARCVTLDTDMKDLAAVFLAEQFGALPVVDGDGGLIGIVSKTDAMRHFYDHAEAAELVEIAQIVHPRTPAPRPASQLTAADLMSRAVFVVQIDTSIGRLAALFANQRIHHAVVVGANGEPVGMVSTLDVARWLAVLAGQHVTTVKPSGAD